MCRANRILNNKTLCNIYLWCKEKKTEIILNHIYNNTDGFIKDKVFIYNTENRIIKKHIIKKEELVSNITIQTKTTDLLKKISQIEPTFIDDFYSFYDEDKNENDKVINLETVTKWLKMRKDHLKRLLQSNFDNNKDYSETKMRKNISLGIGSNNKKMILLTYECAKKICMISKSQQADIIRKNFVELDKRIIKYCVKI